MNGKTVISDVRIILTEANIKNNYLRVRQFGGLVEDEWAEQEITLELEGSGEVATEVDWKKGVRVARCA